MVATDGNRRPRVVRDLAELDTGVHACLLYTTEDERMDALVPYVRDALAAGERVLNLDDSEGRLLLSHLRPGVDGAAEVEGGRIVLRSSGEAYLPDGKFDGDHLRAILATARAEALAAGFRGQRVAADVPAELGRDENLDEWIRYEAALDDSLAGQGLAVLCQYDLTKFAATAIPDIVRVHPIVALGRGPTGPLQVRWLLDQLQGLQRREQEALAL